MGPTRLRILAALEAGLTACWVPTVAGAAETGADPGLPRPDAGAAVTAAAGPAEVALDPDGGPVPVADGEAEVSIGRDADGGLEIGDGGGSSITIGLPGAGTSDGVETAAGLVFEGVAPATDVVARPTDDGAQALIVIDGPQAPATFRFPIGVDGDAAALVERPDGTVEIRSQAGGTVVGTVTPPWATDASGRAVSTAFEVRGSTLVQTVDHRGADYPVVADPNTCGWVTCTYYFGKKATKDFASGGAGLGVCAVISRFGLPGAVVGSACAVYGAAIVVQANRAKNRGMCLKLRYNRVGGPPLIPDIYKDKRCK